MPDTGASLLISMIGIAVLLVFFMYGEEVMITFFSFIGTCIAQVCTDYLAQNVVLWHWAPWIGIIALLVNIGIVMLRRTSDRQERIRGAGYRF